MKLIVAIIRPEKLETVQDVLKPGETYLLSISSVENGTQGRAGMYRGLEIRFGHPAVRLEIAAEDWYAETAVAEIVRVVSVMDSEQDRQASVFMIPLVACVPAVNRQGNTPPLGDRHLMAGCAVRSLPWKR
jgi:nitrogen regulatory protein P-II 1